MYLAQAREFSATTQCRPMQNINTAVFMITLTALSGCTSYYKAPTGIQTAIISFETHTRPVMVQAFANQKCDALPQGVRLAYIDHVFDKQGKYGGPAQVKA
jgi:hypothetical protein